MELGEWIKTRPSRGRWATPLWAALGTVLSCRPAGDRRVAAVTRRARLSVHSKNVGRVCVALLHSAATQPAQALGADR